VWSDGGSTIFKTTEFAIGITIQDCCLAWVDSNFFASFGGWIKRERKWWRNFLVWSSDQLGPTDPPSHVLDGAVCGGDHLAGGSSGHLYAVADNVIVKM
jgi:hypothetical protein